MASATEHRTCTTTPDRRSHAQREDVAFTRALEDASTVVGTPLMDHVVVARQRSCSLLELGLLPVVALESHRTARTCSRRPRRLLFSGCARRRAPGPFTEDSMSNGSTSTRVEHSLPAPLRTAPDMRPRWEDVELSFDDAADRIVAAHAADGHAADLPVTDIKTWAVAPRDGQFALVPLARHHEPKPLRNNAFSNLMARLGAPAEFIRDRLPAPLQIATANWLLSTSDGSTAATLRQRGGEVAAIVSGRYAPLDPIELVDTLRTALSRHGLLHEVRVRGVATGLVDNLRLVLPTEQRTLKKGDVSNVGLDISTSCFGRSAVHIAPVVWRLVCLNGMRAMERGSGLSFRHVGDTDRLRTAVAEAIPTALVHARGVMDQWQRAVTFMVEDVARQIEALRELTIPERKTVEAELLKETGVTALPEHAPLYDLVNALTASAKGAVPARRLEIETMAGELLDRQLGGRA